MHVENWNYIAFGLVFLGAGIGSYLVYALMEHRAIAAEDRRQNRVFSESMKSATAGPHDGVTYDWTPDTLAYLADRYTGAPTAPFRSSVPQPPQTPAAGYRFDYPVPPSAVSEPLPAAVPMTVDPYDTDAFIAQMTARLAPYLNSPEPEPADDAARFIAYMEDRTVHALRQLGVTP